ncbi:MAG: hypothetical protein H7844_00875 [Nitrospirae bacterium YQR-1]
MKTQNVRLNYIAIMNVGDLKATVGLHNFQDVDKVIEHLISRYSAVVVDLRDIWIN